MSEIKKEKLETIDFANDVGPAPAGKEVILSVRNLAISFFTDNGMVELASSDELFAHPLHPYTKALLSAIPKPDPLSEKNRIRKIYNPATAHDYSQQKPTFREILPGHWILCNDAEELKYREEIKTLDIANAAKDKENDRISAVLDTERQTSSASGSTKKKGK